MTKADNKTDWKWQIANRITTMEELSRYVDLSDDECAALNGSGALAFAITPYYAGLLENDALRRTVLPSMNEQFAVAGELEDPLGEENHRASQHLIHTYPDKVLFLATSFCSTYCRYCTRSRIVGKAGPQAGYEDSFAYIAAHPEIRDVLISGGDPLTLTDSVIDGLLGRIRSIPHVRTVRIGSKVPAVLPMRITDHLCEVLRRHRIWLSLHFTHAAELTPETASACRRLADHGVQMVSQTVLLKGVNDSYEALSELFYGLLEIGVKPYYLLQCDPVKGSAHFRTSVERGVELIRSLHGNLSGLAVPQYVIDAPGGGGKVPLLSMDQVRRVGNEIIVTNHTGHAYRYPDPAE
ncbi:MAG: KamA family radical SAM protein [Pontiellaceae bacterium]|nr:KamA family radical SAM protein [Pontiellaceae bacterium]MBN2783394.1 KamA family radical SAM protein [Pontiellaceae bacterium]